MCIRWSLLFHAVCGGIVSVPNSGIVVSCGRHDDGAHDGGDVEGRPLEHEIIEHHLLAETPISPLLQPVLNGNAPRVVDGLRLVPVVVGLDQKPSGIGEGVGRVNLIGIAFDDRSLISWKTGNDIVDGSSDDLRLETLDRIGEVSLVFKHSPHQPHRGVRLLGEHADQILRKILGLSGVDIHWKSTVPDTGQSEDRSRDGVDTEKFLIVGVVFNVDDQFGEDFPHLEVQVAAVHDLPLVVSDQKAGAGLEGGELVHEVEEEEPVEGETAQLGHRRHLGNKILVLELVLGEPLHALEEALGDRQQIEELEEPRQRLFVVSDDRSPSHFGGICQVDLVSQRRVAFDGTDPGHHCGNGEREKKDCNNQLSHDRFIMKTQPYPNLYHWLLPLKL